MSTTDQPQRGLLPTLGWACYLGSSWTWIIGMFFPLLLLRDYGLWGWIVFAVPNVLGAAAMGFILTRESSRRVVERHKTACRWFSEITIAFHVFVIGWLVLGLFGVWGLILAVIVCAATFQAVKRNRGVAAAAAITFVSWGCAAVFLALSPARPQLPSSALSPLDLAMFAPASLVGFVLCPYLDLTFHRARQALEPAAGRTAFTIGFGGVFFSMILFTLLYAPWLIGRGEIRWDHQVIGGIVTILLVHICMQIGLTMGLHGGEASRVHRYRLGTLPAAVTVSLIVIAAAAYFGRASVLDHPPMLFGEFIYRGFLLFYGLVFPAYVWLCMIPSPWKARDVSLSRKRTVFVVATAIALPMGFAGFVLAASWWIPVSLGVLVVARGVIELMGKRACRPPSVEPVA